MDLALDDYAGGAATVTDLLNTRPGFTAGDRLTTRAELAAFCHEHAVPGAVRPGDLAAVRDRRDRLIALVEGGDGARLLAGLHDLLAAVPYRLALRAPAGSEPAWTVVAADRVSAGDALTLTAAVSLLAVVRRLGIERLRACAADDCTGVFVDTSTNGRRRFCTPARCGTRTRVAGHRSRRRTADRGRDGRHPLR